MHCSGIRENSDDWRATHRNSHEFRYRLRATGASGLCEHAGHVVEDALDVGFEGNVDVGALGGTLAAVEDGHAAGEFAVRFDIDAHPLHAEQLRLRDRG